MKIIEEIKRIICSSEGQVNKDSTLPALLVLGPAPSVLVPQVRLVLARSPVPAAPTNATTRRTLTQKSQAQNPTTSRTKRKIETLADHAPGDAPVDGAGPPRGHRGAILGPPTAAPLLLAAALRRPRRRHVAGGRGGGNAGERGGGPRGRGMRLRHFQCGPGQG